MGRILDKLAAVLSIEVVIEGEARGADLMAASWAGSRGIPVMSFPVDWTQPGKPALARNRRMLYGGKPDLVIAFPTIESKGTWHMIGIAKAKGVPTWIMPADEAKIDAIGEGVFA
jgi:hypothetical protein